MRLPAIWLLAVAVFAVAGCRSMPSVSKAKAPAPLIIERAEYQAASGTLTLVGSDGVVNVYEHVPQRVYDRLMAAHSKTDYYIQHIRGRYPVVKIRDARGG